MEDFKDFEYRVSVVRKIVNNILAQLVKAKYYNYTLSMSQGILTEYNGLKGKILAALDNEVNSEYPSFSNIGLCITLDEKDKYFVEEELIRELEIFEHDLKRVYSIEELIYLFEGLKNAINQFSA